MTTYTDDLATLPAPDPESGDECFYYEEWPDEWQGQGAIGALISGGSRCHLSGAANPSCHNDIGQCPLVRDYRKEAR